MVLQTKYQEDAQLKQFTHKQLYKCDTFPYNTCLIVCCWQLYIFINTFNKTFFIYDILTIYCSANIEQPYYSNTPSFMFTTCITRRRSICCNPVMRSNLLWVRPYWKFYALFPHTKNNRKNIKYFRSMFFSF